MRTGRCFGKAARYCWWHLPSPDAEPGPCADSIIPSQTRPHVIRYQTVIVVCRKSISDSTRRDVVAGRFCRRLAVRLVPHQSSQTERSSIGLHQRHPQSRRTANRSDSQQAVWKERSPEFIRGGAARSQNANPFPQIHYCPGEQRKHRPFALAMVMIPDAQ
jgi:hypothetical protein